MTVYGTPNTTTEINRLEQLQRIFPDYRKETHVPSLINQLNWDSLYTRRLIKQASMPNKIHYHLVNTSPPTCVQHATRNIFNRISHMLHQHSHPCYACVQICILSEDRIHMEQPSIICCSTHHPVTISLPVCRHVHIL